MANQQDTEFFLKERKHIKEARGAKCSLGPGMVPVDGEKELGIPVALNRTRVVHDGAEMYVGDSFVSTAGRDETAQASSSHWQSSYQAACAGTVEAQKKTGKKIVLEAASGARSGSNLNFFGGVPGPSRPQDEGFLKLGTTQASNHIPGYGGHIPKKPEAAAAPVQARSLNRDLIIENYKPYPGYTGRKGY